MYEEEIQKPLREPEKAAQGVLYLVKKGAPGEPFFGKSFCIMPTHVSSYSLNITSWQTTEYNESKNRNNIL